MTNITPTLLTDGYKIDHRRQYPKETKTVYSNMTPRKSRVEGVNEVVVYGIQAYLISTLVEIWNKNFFERPFEEIAAEFLQTMEEYTLSKQFAEQIGVEHWRALHNLGYLPLEIKALPEGSLCPIKVPFFTVKNTHPDFYWLTNFIETDMSAEVWGPLTSATTAYQYKKIFTHFAELTGGASWFIPYQGHDFSYRGMFGRQAAMLSGSGHLTSFYGTDTIPAISFLKTYYGAKSTEETIGCSVFATEHAVMCVTTGFYIRKNNLTWERYGDAEYEVFKRLITEVYPTGIVSVVSDTWNLWKVLTEYLPKLKEEILSRDGKLVIRPDSGDPIDIITGLDNKVGYEIFTREGELRLKDHNTGISKVITEAERKGVVELLWDIFGGELNAKGFKELNPKIGCIYGDSITLRRAWSICERLMWKTFASTNWVAGIGSFTYQFTTRDTFGIAQKATYAEVEIDGELVGIEIFKDPITDDGTKKSAKGLMAVLKNAETGKFYLKDQATWAEEAEGYMTPVFLNGKLVNLVDLHTIRQRLNDALVASMVEFRNEV